MLLNVDRVRARLWISAGVWVLAIVIAIAIAGPAIGWALLSVTGFLVMSAGVVLALGGRRRPVLGWALTAVGVAAGVFGIAELALNL
jgi:hypothetical protein